MVKSPLSLRVLFYVIVGLGLELIDTWTWYYLFMNRSILEREEFGRDSPDASVAVF